MFSSKPSKREEFPKNFFTKYSLIIIKGILTTLFARVLMQMRLKQLKNILKQFFGVKKLSEKREEKCQRQLRLKKVDHLTISARRYH